MGKRIIGNPTTTPMAIPDWNQTDPLRADFIKNKPTKLSQFENDSKYLTEHQDISGIETDIIALQKDKADKLNTYTKDEVDNKEDAIWAELDYLVTRVVDIPYEDLLIDEGITQFYQSMVSNNNFEYRLPELTILSIEFEDAEYDRAYMSSLSFDSGATPTSIDYTDSGILNWVGTDCTTADGLSIFQPSANTHYDIVFYFNGVQFIGLVNGFVPATGNVVSV